MTNGLAGEVTYEKVLTTEETWKPGARKIEVVLQPIYGEGIYYPWIYPYGPIPEIPEIVPRSVVIDIETTGPEPYDSRIITIGVVDIRNPENIISFTNEDEELMVKEFIAWFELNGFDEIIGYNVSFDYRFIFAKLLRYRLPSKAFMDADLYDVMQMMKQAKMAFVFGYNKPGTLEQWAAYLFGEKKILTFEEILIAWEEERIYDIIKHNKHDVELCLMLWALIKYVQGEISA